MRYSRESWFMVHFDDDAVEDIEDVLEGIVGRLPCLGQ